MGGAFVRPAEEAIAKLRSEGFTSAHIRAGAKEQAAVAALLLSRGMRVAEPDELAPLLSRNGSRYVISLYAPFLREEQHSEAFNAELMRLAEAACAGVAKPKMLEVGSWLGGTALRLGRIAQQRGGALYCVDIWSPGGLASYNEIADQLDTLGHFRARIGKAGLAEVVHPMAMPSAAAAAVLADRSFDFIFIDGDHRYSGIRADIADFLPKIKAGGVFCGDDCEGRPDDFGRALLEAHKEEDWIGSAQCHPGVILAVHERFPTCAIQHGLWSVRS